VLPLNATLQALIGYGVAHGGRTRGWKVLCRWIDRNTVGRVIVGAIQVRLMTRVVFSIARVSSIGLDGRAGLCRSVLDGRWAASLIGLNGRWAASLIGLDGRWAVSLIGLDGRWRRDGRYFIRAGAF
jgi:hypothetical protein